MIWSVTTSMKFIYLLLVMILQYTKLVICKVPGKVLLISIDGLRWDFPLSPESEVLQHMAENGVIVERVKNVLPTNTYPNHQSLVTGLYPEGHGIIDNEMYDNNTKEYFRASIKDGNWYKEAETIWIKNQNAGYRSGSVFYPGSHFDLQELSPTFSAVQFTNSTNSMSYKERIDLMVDWLSNGSDVTFVAAYFEDFDSLSHDIAPPGIISNQNKTWHLSKQLINQVLDYFVKRLDEEKLLNDTNIIITGDHGCTVMEENNAIYLEECLENPKKYIEAVTGLTFVSIYPKAGKLSYIYNRLKNCSKNYEIYLKDSIPENWHIKHSNRTAPIVLLAKKGYLIDTGLFNASYGMTFPRGEHGYSPDEADMNPGFVAIGPAFKKGYRQKNIETVDIYQLMCHIIGLEPNVNDGQWSRVFPLLKDSAS